MDVETPVHVDMEKPEPGADLLDEAALNEELGNGLVHDDDDVQPPAKRARTEAPSSDASVTTRAAEPAVTEPAATPVPAPQSAPVPEPVAASDATPEPSAPPLPSSVRVGV